MSEDRKQEKASEVNKEKFSAHLFGVLDHIDNVRDAGRILMKGLIKDEEFDLVLSLAYRLSIHDSGKFTYVEWKGMGSDNAELKKIAIEHHRRSNPHHIQYHDNDVKNMSDIDIAEWCCDIKARSEEFGTGVKEFVKKFAEEKGISVHSYFYKRAMYFFSIILEPPFKPI